MKLFFSRFYAILKGRNLEFFRDKSSLTWSIVFPVLLLVGFALVFSGDGKDQFKVGLLNSPVGQGAVNVDPSSFDTSKQASENASEKLTHSAGFLATKYVEFVDYENSDVAIEKLRQHRLDMLIDFESKQYWINESSPNGYFMEKLLVGYEPSSSQWQQQTVDGRQIRYLDFVLPGILGMNMMFSCLFGVGYVIVRYRKNMVLKRLNATPVTAFEFLTAQVVSRLFIVMFLSTSVFVGCDFLFDFYMLGSYLDLFIVGILGAFSLISLGLMIASRSRSEELTGGLLNLATWPMMILSGVWFSLEGSPEFIQQIAYALPLTHLVEGARAVMTEGASLADIADHVLVMVGMTVVFLGIGTTLFRWEGDGR